MRRLDLTDTKVKRLVQDGNPTKPPQYVGLLYPMKSSVTSLMFHPGAKLNGLLLAKQNVLALKIDACEVDYIDLTDEEYLQIKGALDSYQGFCRDDVEMVRRIAEAPEI